MKKPSGSYKLVYTRSALKDSKKLDPIVRKRIGKKILLYSQTPIAYARKLVNPQIGDYRWKIGRHRVVFDLIGKKIIIHRIKHRKEVYN